MDSLRRWEMDPNIQMPERLDIDGRTTGYRAADVDRWRLRQTVDALLSSDRSLRHPLPDAARPGEFAACRRLKAKARQMDPQARLALWERTREELVGKVAAHFRFSEYPGAMVQAELARLRALDMPQSWDPYRNPMQAVVLPKRGGDRTSKAVINMLERTLAEATAQLISKGDIDISYEEADAMIRVASDQMRAGTPRADIVREYVEALTQMAVVKARGQVIKGAQ